MRIINFKKYKHIIVNFYNTKFFRNISTLFFGSAGAQVLSVLVIPVLTRMYDVENFGARAVMISVASLLGIIATGRYEQAILLPEKEKDSFSVAVFAGVLSFIVSGFTGVILLFIPHDFLQLWFNLSDVRLLLYLPMMVFIGAIYNILCYCFNRINKYSIIATTSVFCVLINFGVAFLCAYFYGANNYGLILYLLVGQLAICIYGIWFLHNYITKKSISLTVIDMIEQMKRYIDFPKYEIVGFFVNVLSTQLPVLALNSFGGQSIVGLFSMTQKLLGMPTAIIGSAISRVFIHDAAEEYRENGSCRNVYNKTFLLVTITGFIPYMIIFFFAEDLFGILLGAKWIPAAKYCKYLCMMYYLSYVTSPLSNVLLLTENQRVDVLLQVFRLFISAVALYGAHYLSGNNDMVVLSYGVAFVGIYLVDMGLNYHYSRRK